jgi:hypothetical protein
LILIYTIQCPEIAPGHDCGGEAAVSIPPAQTAMGLDHISEQWSHAASCLLQGFLELRRRQHLARRAADARSLRQLRPGTTAEMFISTVRPGGVGPFDVGEKPFVVPDDVAANADDGPLSVVKRRCARRPRQLFQVETLSSRSGST